MEIINNYLEEIKKRGHVDTVILFGSFARGNNRPNSDIDLIVIRDGKTIRTTEEFDGTMIELTYTSADSIKKYWEGKKNDCAELWGYAKVIFDNNGIGKELEMFGKNIRDNGPEKLDNEQIGHLKFDLEDQIKAINNLITSDRMTAELLINKKILDCLHLFFTLKTKWVPAIKQQIGEIKKTDTKMFSLIEKIYRDTDLKAKLKTLTEIKSHLFNK